MGAALTVAFTHAAHAFHTIADTCTKMHDAYDRAGLFLWRAMMDADFLALHAAPTDSGTYHQAVTLYDQAKCGAQAWVYDTLSTKGAAGDFGPKPDIKPGLMKIAEAGMPYVTRVNWSSPAMIAMMLVAAATATYAMTHTGAQVHGMADAVGTVYGAAPKGLQPKQP